MSCIVLVVTVLILACAEAKPSTIDSGRIVGGEEVSIEDFPYQVSLQYFGSHFCGGSILSATVIVTAAHCTAAVPLGISIRAGSSNRGSGGFTSNVASVRQHNLYNPKTIDNDISILILQTPLPYGPKIQPINLATSQTSAGTTATVSGWGTTSTGGSSPSMLRAVNVSVISQDICKQNYSSLTITDQMICASAPGKDSCQGDSGGPLIVRNSAGNKLIGIVSWGADCADPTHPGVYTNVFKLRDWISSNMNAA